jgi:1-acyl-sn-glycerol-3-phosphate acyltransferase
MADLVYPPVITTAKTVFWAMHWPITVTGTEHVPASGPAVLASNHVSYLDFLFVGYGARPAGRLVRFMAKEEIFAHWLAGPLMRGMHHIPVDRAEGASSYKAALKALRDGEVLGLFPEATVSRAFEVKSMKAGAARMAMATGAPLIPVVTWGGQRLYTKGRKPTFTRNVPITVAIGEPLHPTRKDDATAVTDELRTRLRAMLDEVRAAYPAQPSGPDDRWWLPASMGGTAPTLDEAAELDEANSRGHYPKPGDSAAE